MTATTTVLGKGSGLLEKPTIEKTTPGRDSEFDLRYNSVLFSASISEFQYESVFGTEIHKIQNSNLAS